MKFRRILIVFVLLCVLQIFCNTKTVNAAFDLETKNATYDSNTGILSIYDSNFYPDSSQGRYVANLDKIKLGNITLKRLL